MSRQLTVIALDAPVATDPEQYAVGVPDEAAVDDLLERLKFGPMTRRRVREHLERMRGR
jgi:hypothetical protein